MSLFLLPIWCTVLLDIEFLVNSFFFLFFLLASWTYFVTAFWFLSCPMWCQLLIFLWVHLRWWHFSLDAFQSFLFVFGFGRFDCTESSGYFCVCVSWSSLNLLWVCWMWRSIFKNKKWGVLAFFSNSFCALFWLLLLGFPLHICCYSWWYPSCLGDSVHFCSFFSYFFIILDTLKFADFFFLLPCQIYNWTFSEFSATFIELQNFYLVPFYNFSVFFSFYILYLVNHYVHTFIFSLNTDSFISLTIFIIVTLNFFKFCIWTPLEFLLMALLPEYCSQCFHVSSLVSYFTF